MAARRGVQRRDVSPDDCRRSSIHVVSLWMGPGSFARLRNGGGEGESRFGAADATTGGAVEADAKLEIELDTALEALMADADELTTAARWRAAPDAAFYGFGSLALDSEISETNLATKLRHVYSNGVLLKSQ